jgi:phage baseplate assembly protein gpV
MLNENGSRNQESMRTNPAVQEVRECFYTLRGVIQPNGVLFKDAPLNKTGQTLVNISLLGGYPDIYRVPLACSKANPNNGEEWTPEPGDMVLVQFINGSFHAPVITGFLYQPGNNHHANAAEAPRYHRRRNGTDEKIEKNGTRSVYVAADDILEVVGDGDIYVHGKITIHVVGTADITVDGDTTITTPNAIVHAATKVQLDTPLTECTGNLNVNGGITCLGTYGSTGGKIQTPGDIESTGGEVKDQVRAMSADRSIYNSHTHPGDSGGTTGTPTQQQ